MAEIAILMATYNGAAYLREQLDSIILQTNQDWDLYIRDDGSIDDTREILNEYSSRYPSRINLIDDRNLNGGSAKANFGAIHSWVTVNYPHSYYMLSDQDDYWMPNKVQAALDCIKKNEEVRSRPVLIHSDLEVVDKDLCTIGPSFFKYRALNPNTKDLPHLLIQNNITGCTMMWNSELNSYLDLTRGSIAMHDWWIAITASAFGVIDYVAYPTIKYRQHDKNVVGATKVNSASFIISRLLGANHVKTTLQLAFDQANAFYDLLGKKMKDETRRQVINFCMLPSYCKMKRICAAIKGNYLKQGFIQKIGELLYI